MSAKRNSRQIEKLPQEDQITFNKNLEAARDISALESWDRVMNQFPGLSDLPQRFVPGGHAYSGKEASTKLRPIWNSSSTNGKYDPSFNFLSLKGPRSNDLIKSFTHFCQHPFSAICDIKMAFYNLKIDERAIALRKVWLPLDKDNKIAFGKNIDGVHWEVYTFTSSAMGDIGAPALLFLTICKAAEMFCPGHNRMSK